MQRMKFLKTLSWVHVCMPVDTSPSLSVRSLQQERCVVSSSPVVYDCVSVFELWFLNEARPPSLLCTIGGNSRNIHSIVCSGR